MLYRYYFIITIVLGFWWTASGPFSGPYDRADTSDDRRSRWRQISTKGDHMRTKDELELVRFANDLIHRFWKSGPSVAHIDEEEFFDELLKHENHAAMWKAMMDFISMMSNSKLGTIVGLRLGKRDEYQKTHFLQTMPVELYGVSVHRSGHIELVTSATPVIIAAIYDILKTEDVIRGQSAVPESYIPKRAMRSYVLKHRLGRGAE